MLKFQPVSDSCLMSPKMSKEKIPATPRWSISMSDEATFIEAAQNSDTTTVVAMLVAEPALVNAAGEYDKTALHWAAEKDFLEIATALLDAGADIEARTSWGATPFEWAAVMGSSRV